jgi:phosphopantothenoylcysteine decarboxylase/phosphopantothenate--cysteine ligase
MLQGKKILLGVCGGIAAYKSALLIRLLIKEGAEVQVIMTSAAHEFITPLTLATLSNRPVHTKFSTLETGEWNSHVELGLWADVMLIAPATANTMARLALGVADNLLGATYLSARCPVIFAPAMDLDMYRHPATTANAERLSGYGNLIIEAEHGELASGLVGTGRMAEPENIVAYLHTHFAKKKVLKGKNLLITAGPTYEAIDPVRFIGNHSSGKMGAEIARVAASQGANVTLVLGPGSVEIKESNISVQRVTSASEMFAACDSIFDQQDLIILAAAVADYSPVVTKKQKIKKKGQKLSLELKKTVDIAQSLGERKSQGQFIVGFALETENEIDNAKSKLHKKNFDLIVLNSLNDKGAGFQHDTNKISIIDRQNNIKEFQLKDKTSVAKDIIDEVIARLS